MYRPTWKQKFKRGWTSLYRAGNWVFAFRIVRVLGFVMVLELLALLGIITPSTKLTLVEVLVGVL